MEDAGPANAFDGSDQTRWMDVRGGGIGNKATLLYEHTSAAKVTEYSFTTQGYALSSYHSHLNGTPRDWALKARQLGSGEQSGERTRPWGIVANMVVNLIVSASINTRVIACASHSHTASACM